MSGKIPIHPGDRLKITIKKRRRKDESGAAQTGAPRGILPVSKSSARYIRRKSGLQFEFYDLGLRYDLVTHSYQLADPRQPDAGELNTAYLAGDPLGVIHDSIDRPVCFRLPFESEFLYLDLILSSQSGTERFVVGRGNVRPSLVTLPAPSPLSVGWNEQGKVKARFNSDLQIQINCLYYYQYFDTADNASFKLTRGADPSSAEAEDFKLGAGVTKVYLRPNLFNTFRNDVGDPFNDRLPVSPSLDINLPVEDVVESFPGANRVLTATLSGAQAAATSAYIDGRFPEYPELGATLQLSVEDARTELNGAYLCGMVITGGEVFYVWSRAGAPIHITTPFGAMREFAG